MKKEYVIAIRFPRHNKARMDLWCRLYCAGDFNIEFDPKGLWAVSFEKEADAVFFALKWS